MMTLLSKLIPAVLWSVLAGCSGQEAKHIPGQDSSTEPSGLADLTEPGPLDNTTWLSLPGADGGATEPKAFTCPGPPADALTFEAGTLHADRLFGRDIRDLSYYGDPPRWGMPDGMVLVLTGVSYVADDHCINLTERYHSEFGSVWLLTDPIKNGERVGDYLFKLNLTIPGSSLSDYIGEFTDGGGHTANPNVSAHQLHHTQLHQPIFFTADLWATNMGPDEATRNRSCMMNVADGSKTLDEIFAE